MAEARPPDEMQRMLTKMVEAREELKSTISQAHAMRRDLLHTIKVETDALRQIVHDEVASTVALLTRETRDEMVRHVERVIDNIERDWRLRLHL